MSSVFSDVMNGVTPNQYSVKPMSEWFGVGAVKEHEVHHKNGIPWDNRLSNLELLTTEEHARYHVNDKQRDDSGRFV